MKRMTRREAGRCLAGGLAGSALGLSGAGTSPASAATLPAGPSDVELITAAVAFEQRSVLAYAEASRSRYLGRAHRSLVVAIARAEREQCAVLETLLEALGGSAPQPAEAIADAIARADDEGRLLGALDGLERASIAAYSRLLGDVAEPALARVAAGLLAAEAQHLEMIREARGREGA